MAAGFWWPYPGFPPNPYSFPLPYGQNMDPKVHILAISQKMWESGQHEDIQPNESSRSQQPAPNKKELPEITLTVNNSKYFAFGRCSEVGVTQEAPLLLLQALVFQSCPTFDRANFYASNFVPSFLGFEDQQRFSFILYFFPEIL